MLGWQSVTALLNPTHWSLNIEGINDVAAAANVDVVGIPTK